MLLLTPADGSYAWIGPANDTVGAMSALAVIPVAVALLTVCGNRPGLGRITSLAIVAMVVTAALSLLYVLGQAPWAAELDGSYADARPDLRRRSAGQPPRPPRGRCYKQ